MLPRVVGKSVELEEPITYALPPLSTVDPLAVVDRRAAEERRVDERRAGGVELGDEHVVLAASVRSNAPAVVG